MQKVKISDVTLREREKSEGISFREKLEIVKKLDKLNVDIIETPIINNTKTDILFLHTAAPLLKNSILSCPVAYDEQQIEKTAEALSAAAKKRLHLMIPTSTVQMEYLCGKKPKAVLEMIKTLTEKCVSVCEDVEFSALDATRSEREFLFEAVKTAVSAGATTITVCDSAGEMLPEEFAQFIKDIYENVPELKDVTLSAECNNTLGMASSCMVSAISAGVRGIKTAVDAKDTLSLVSAAQILKAKGDFLQVEADLKYTELEHTASRMTGGFTYKEEKAVEGEEFTLTAEVDIKTVSAVIAKMGYELSEEDISAVYTEFKKAADKKKVGKAEIEAIIAGTAMQVAPTYKLKEYVINSGNKMSASAVMVLEKNGTEIQGVTVGDGPVDAAFRCIEQIASRHLELDDFCIRSVTDGREAMGETLVKLRSSGRLYSGRGISTDIVESSIKAYINALNKICFEEE